MQHDWQNIDCLTESLIMSGFFFLNGWYIVYWYNKFRNTILFNVFHACINLINAYFPLLKFKTFLPLTAKIFRLKKLINVCQWDPQFKFNLDRN